MTRVFRDREEAARTLVPLLTRYEGRSDAVVLAIPRGGLVTGRVVADALGLPLDVALTKKIGHPEQPELAIGAVSLEHEDVDADTLAREGVSREYLAAEIARMRRLLRERHDSYHAGRRALPLKGKTVLIVDDGIATGFTIIAAARLARRAGARRVVIAAPVAPASSLPELRRACDEVVCALTPDRFGAIGEFYDEFDAVSDDKARGLLCQEAL